MESEELAIKIIRSCLQLSSNEQSIEGSTQLLGGFPEFNSLTIAAIIASIEDELDCDIDDNEISAEIFETVNTLSDFIAEKISKA